MVVIRTGRLLQVLLNYQRLTYSLWKLWMHSWLGLYNHHVSWCQCLKCASTVQFGVPARAYRYFHKYACCTNQAW